MGIADPPVHDHRGGASQLKVKVLVHRVVDLWLNLLEKLGQAVQVAEDQLGQYFQVQRKWAVISSNWVDPSLHKCIEVGKKVRGWHHPLLLADN